MGYRDILRGPQLKTDYDKYIIWLGKSSEEKQTLYKGAREGTRFEYPKQTLWVAPFGQAAKNLFVEIKGPATGAAAPASTLLSLLANLFVATRPAAASDTVLTRSVFPLNKLAKLSLKLRVTTATVDSKSRITGRGYKHHATNSVSMPFGKNAAADDYADAVRAIQSVAAYKTFVNTLGNSAQFIPEG